MRILIAEDDEILQNLLDIYMNDWGYHFDIASNGMEAVELAQKNEGKYDLCLMDIQMPKMNGIEAAKIIRRTVKYFPILAYSTNARYKSKCIEAGMDSFIRKPCAHNDLFAKINALLSGG